MRWKPKSSWKWHRWFAWHPVRVGDDKVWLEYIERRISGCDPYGAVTFWSYRPITAAADEQEG